MILDNHPSVIAFRQRQQNNQPEAMTSQRLKAIVLEAVAAGLAWLALSLIAVDTFRRNRARRN